MKKLFITILTLGFIICQAQKLVNPKTFARIITAEDLKKQLFVIAGPEMEGRETGTAGQRKAAVFIQNSFQQIGLLPGNKESYQLMYDIYQDSLASSSLEINGQAFETDKDYNALATDFQATMRFSEIVLVGANVADSLKNTNLAGKLVMIFGNLPFGRSGNNSPFSFLQNKGIAGLLAVTSYPRSIPSNRKGNAGTSLFRRSLNPEYFTISDHVAQAILGSNYETAKSSATSIQNYQAEIFLDIKKTTISLQSSDVIGLLPGTDLRNQYVVISAHYDHLGIRNGHIYYGADDDGSGTVSIIELAKAFMKSKTEGKGPRRSIIFLANSGEEEGLWGSEYYTSHPSFPLAQTTVDLNIDMIGRIDPNRKNGDSTNYVYVVGDDKLSSELHPISTAQNNTYTKMELDYKFNDPSDPDRIYFRSDHYNFAKNGVPIIFYFDGIHADYHKPTDTPDKINYSLMAKRAQLVFYTAWDMANRNEMLKRDISLNTNFSR